MDRPKKNFSLYLLVMLHVRSLLRNPFCMLLALGTSIITLMLPLTFAYTFDDGALRLARDGGLSFQLIMGIGLAIYTACALTARGKNSGTDAMILVKPTSPAVLFLSRYAGLSVILMLFSLTCACATALAQRIAESFTRGIGYHVDLTTAMIGSIGILLTCIAGLVLDIRNRSTFPTTVFMGLPIVLLLTALLTGFYDRSGHWTGGWHHQLDLSTFLSALLIASGLLLFAALALLLSLLLAPVSVAGYCFVLLAAGLLVNGWLSTRIAEWGLRTVILALIPNWQHIWIPATRLKVDCHEIAQAILYLGCYTVIILILGCHRYAKLEHLS